MIRRIVFVAMIGLSWAAALPAANSPSSLLAEANAKYKAGDFKAAVAAYQNLLTTQGETGPLLYNLGNASLRTGEKGQAMVYYLRALEASPRDKDLRWNIQVLRGSLVDRIEDKGHFALSAAREAIGYLRSDELRNSFTVLVGLLVLLGLIGFFLRSAGGWLGVLKAVVTLALVVSASLLAFRYWQDRDPTAVVLEKEVYTHFGPSETESRAFALHEGAVGRVTDVSGDWIYLSLADKKTAWIRKNACEIV